MQLPYTTRQRLILYRTRAKASKYSNDWRQHKYGNTYNMPWHSGIRKDGLILTDDRDTLGDYLGDWGQFLRGRCWDALGFYADSFEFETIKGGVVRLRTARFTLYIPCTYCTGWDGATLYFAMAERVERGSTEEAHEAAAREAAATAYGRAEHEADVAREDDAKQRAAEDIEDARAEIHNGNRQALALLAEIRGREFTENVCEALRYRLRCLLDDRRQCFDRIKERRENYWSAVPC